MNTDITPEEARLLGRALDNLLQTAGPTVGNATLVGIRSKLSRVLAGAPRPTVIVHARDPRKIRRDGDAR